MLRKEASGSVTGGDNGRREGASAGSLLSGGRRRYGRVLLGIHGDGDAAIDELYR